MNANIKIQTGFASLLLLLCTIYIYSPRLVGPFVFDDFVLITKNENVKIPTLDVASLRRAWQSSPSKFASDRPLSQLSFGVNHALLGLSPVAFKTGKLSIHLACG
jgi:hypothetical protein